MSDASARLRGRFDALLHMAALTRRFASLETRHNVCLAARFHIHFSNSNQKYAVTSVMAWT
jgi:hypothetical protein